MNYRAIELQYKNEYPYWVGNGFRVRQYFPNRELGMTAERLSPFLLMDYHEPYHYRGTEVETGVGPHPHRGFETVTFVFAGKVEHGDNQGNHGVIEAGDIQWMTAARGILHKEFHEREYARQDRVLHLIQLWVDLPRRDKLSEPKYQAITAERMGRLSAEDGSYALTVYAGEALGVEGPARSFSPMNLYKLEISKGARLTLDEPADYNTALLLLSGELGLNDAASARTGDFVLFANEAGTILVEGRAERSELFVLSGQPLRQPVVARGPFAMNSEEEVRQAEQDFRAGRFGSLDF